MGLSPPSIALGFYSLCLVSLHKLSLGLCHPVAPSGCMPLFLSPPYNYAPPHLLPNNISIGYMPFPCLRNEKDRHVMVLASVTQGIMLEMERCGYAYVVPAPQWGQLLW
jgi:hypothetical protein